MIEIEKNIKDGCVSSFNSKFSKLTSEKVVWQTVRRITSKRV